MKRLLYFLPIILAFIFPFGNNFVPKVLFVWTILSLVYIFYLHYHRNLSILNKELRIIDILLFTIFIAFSTSLIYSINYKEGFIAIVQKLSLIILPISFLTFDFTDKSLSNKLLRAFVAGNFLSSFICLFFAFYSSINFINGSIDFNIWLPINHLDVNTSPESFFTYTNLSLFLHPSYFSLYILVSILILVFVKDLFSIENYLLLKALLIIWFCCFIFLLSSRAGIISLVLFFIGLLFTSKLSILKKVTALIILSILVLASYKSARLHYLYMNVYNFKKIESYYEQHNYKELNSFSGNSRLAIWSVAYEEVKHCFPLGLGIGDVRDVLTQKYTAYGLTEQAKIRANAHNEYLEIFLQCGLFGLVLLITIIVFSIIVSIQKSDLFLLSFIIVVMFNFMFESMLNQLSGVSLFSFFLVFLHKRK